MSALRWFDELWSDLEPLGRNESTGGYHRYAWTAVDADLRSWFRSQAETRGLDVVEDRAGNLWAWWGDPDADGPGVVTGSHLDAVPEGGAFDGPLGVVSAFLALDRMRAFGAVPSRPLGIACFADEEGGRFGVACTGSRVLTGSLAPERALALRDGDGVTLADALRRSGKDPASLAADPEALSRVGTFVELHVEQGRALADLDWRVGVGSGIHPHGRWRFDLVGEANHAGTTRLEDRDDPMLVLAALVQRARTAARDRGCVATVGKVSVEPNAVNAIPSLVQAWLDARGADAEAVRGVVADVSRAAAVAAVEESFTAPTAFDPSLTARVAALLDAAPVLATGAGHDAGVLALAGVPTAMLFVRNPTGVSHAPAEHAERDDCVAGVRALATVLTDLTGAGGPR